MGSGLFAVIWPVFPKPSQLHPLTGSVVMCDFPLAPRWIMGMRPPVFNPHHPSGYRHAMPKTLKSWS